MCPLESDQISADLSLLVDQGQSAAAMGNVIALACEQISVALAKAVGKEGVDAMFRRSLLLTAPTVAWDFPVPSERQTVAELVPLLRVTFAHRSASDAASAGSALLQTFYELLANLIGRTYTEQLLRPILVGALHTRTG